jgi:hypothetical protein
MLADQQNTFPYVQPPINCDQGGRPFLSFYVNNVLCKGMLDSGSMVNLIGMNDVNTFSSLGYCPAWFSGKLCAVDNHTFDTKGSITVPVSYDQRSFYVTFLITSRANTGIIFGARFLKSSGLAPDLFPEDSHSPASQIEDNIVCSTSSPPSCLTSRSDLSPDQLCSLNQISELFDGISFEKIGLGRTQLVNHIIDTGDSNPVKQKTYPASHVRREQLCQEIDKMIELDVIEPARSPWLNNVFMVPKKDGSGRFVLDPRRLNEVTRADSYRLPNINRILDNLRDTKFLSALDLSHGFWQMPLHPDSRPKTAFFVEGRGQY